MVKQKDPTTTKGWDQYETEKREELRLAREELKALQDRRAPILLRIAEEDPSASADLKTIKDDISKVEERIEGLEILLKTIPAKKDYARGVELEAVIPQVEKVEDELSGLVKDVEKKAAALQSACEKLDNHLPKFHELIPIKLSFFDAGISNVVHVGRVLSASYQTGISVDNGVVYGAIAMDKTELSAWLNNTRNSIAKRLGRAREHVRRLKGEEFPDPPTYCPHCFADTLVWREPGKNYCSNCGKGF